MLERSKRTLRLTDVGALYFDHCRRGLEAFNVANQVVEERQSEASGLLRITVPPNFTEALMLPIIDLFRQRYPNAHIAVFVTERMMDFIVDPIDLSFRVAPVSDPVLVVRRLSTYRHVLVASLTCPGDLTGHDLLGFGFRGAGEIRWTLSCNKCGRARFVSADRRRQRLQRSLVPLLEDGYFPDVELLAVHTGARSLSRLARLFLDACIEHIAALGPNFMRLGRA